MDHQRWDYFGSHALFDALQIITQLLKLRLLTRGRRSSPGNWGQEIVRIHVLISNPPSPLAWFSYRIRIHNLICQPPHSPKWSLSENHVMGEGSHQREELPQFQSLLLLGSCLFSYSLASMTGLEICEL